MAIFCISISKTFSFRHREHVSEIFQRLIVEISFYAIAAHAFLSTWQSHKRRDIFTAIKYWRCGIIALDTVKMRALPGQ